MQFKKGNLDISIECFYSEIKVTKLNLSSIYLNKRSAVYRFQSSTGAEISAKNSRSNIRGPVITLN